MIRRLAVMASLLACGCSTLPGTLLVSAVVGAGANGAIGLEVAPSNAQGRGFAAGAISGAIGATAIVWGIIVGNHIRFASPDADRTPPATPSQARLPALVTGHPFVGQPGYLVILDLLDSHSEAQREAHALRVSVVQSALLDGFAPGKFLLVASAHDSQYEAEAALAQLPPRSSKPWVQRFTVGRGTLPGLVLISGKVAGGGTPVITIKTGADAFATKPDADCGGCYEFWVASPGPVSITIAASDYDDSSQNEADCFLNAPRTGTIDVPVGARGHLTVTGPLDLCHVYR